KTLNKRQDKIRSQNAYDYLKKHQFLDEIEDVSQRIQEMTKTRGDVPADENSLVLEVGACSELTKKNFSEVVRISEITGEAFTHALFELWLKGIDIDWQALYPAGSFQKMALPVYPFNGERHWLPKSKPVVSDSQYAVKIHPLIDRNISTLQEQKFSTRLTGREFYLSDHRVFGHAVLPGVVYLEMVRAAGEMAGSGKIQKIKNVEWVRPIRLDDGPREVQISLYPAKGHVEYEVSTSNGDNPRLVCCRGMLVSERREPKDERRNIGSDDTEGTECERIDIEAVKKRCENQRSGRECYRLFETMGLEYGPGFQSIEALHYNDKEALSRLKLPLSLRDAFDDFVLHPALADGALQTVMGLIHDTKAGDLFLPFSLGETEIMGPLSETCYAYATPVKAGEVRTFNVRLMDPFGRVLVKMLDFSMLPARGTPTRIKPTPSEALHFKHAWKRSDGNRIHPDISGPILVLDTDEALALAYRKQRLRERAILVKPGVTYREIDEDAYTINPEAREDYHRLIRAVCQKHDVPGRIIHLWSKNRHQASKSGSRDTGMDLFGGKASVNGQLSDSVYSLLYLSQALMAQKPKASVRLLYCYENGSNSTPLHAAICGFARTVRLENAKFVYQTLGLEDVYHTGSVLDSTLKEFQTGDSTAEVRYTGGQRQIKHFQEIDVGAASVDDVPLKKNGVYLVTGGLGGLGLIFAEYLARKWKARLVLTGRSDLSPEKEKRLKKIGGWGTEAAYIKADVAKRDAVQKLIAEIKSRFKGINGVIHAAGVLRDAFVLKKTKQDVDAVLAPKVYGTIFLDEATRDENLDFFVLFSSIAAVMGNLGQCDYAYANSFMDHFAVMREALRKGGKRSGKTLSINWPLWEEGGMGVDTQKKAWLKNAMGLLPLNTDHGLKAFEKGLRMAELRIMPLEGDGEKIKKTLDIDSGNPTERTGTMWDIEPKLSDREKIQLLEKTEIFLKEMLSAETKLAVSKINSKEPLEKYGIDSLMILNLDSKLEKHFGELSKTLFFEYQTLSE
ncbi:SDR family NAD(P)-dependent oxidoreductase, partial [Thermodesulfobacteriota bacterium]